MKSRDAVALLVPLVLAMASVTSVYAQSGKFPSRPIRILIGSAPGGGLDQTARVISDRFSAALGQTIVIDNRPGAAGTLAAQILKDATPDGHTLNLGAIGNLAVNYSLYKNIGYHPLKDLAPVTAMVDAANVVVVHPSVAATTIKELVALASKQPGMTYGSSGAGNAGHLAGELFKRMARVELTHVPYKGGGPAMLDLVGGRINMIFASPSSSIPHIKSGRIRGLAVTTRKRSVIVPELPTVAEAGIPGYEVNNWYAMVAPAKTPKAIIARLNKELVAILNDAEIRRRLVAHGVEAAPSTPEDLGKYMKSEFEKWGKLIAEAGITAK
ncbi:MAG TPA: tripartite tricarboxylate transporter substrate binding protein [Burkholderiales bacterium]|nr:tripartite tricarboxylate transporter substrate binding protein [Burkholderiales bacterium]